jgi:hypothetical protein
VTDYADHPVVAWVRSQVPDLRFAVLDENAITAWIGRNLERIRPADVFDLLWAPDFVLWKSHDCLPPENFLDEDVDTDDPPVLQVLAFPHYDLMIVVWGPASTFPEGWPRPAGAERFRR